jgi:hypothetical protein
MLNSIPIIEKWFESSGEVGDDVFFVKGRRNLRSMTESGKFPTRIDVIWEFESPDSTGQPSQSTLMEMEAMEELLLESMEKDFQSVLAGIFTGNGHREWYWYTQDKDEFLSRFNACMGKRGGLPLEIFHQNDPDWNEYKDMLEAFSIDF